MTPNITQEGRTCSECGERLGRGNMSGRCRKCFLTARRGPVDRRPNIKAKERDAIMADLKDIMTRYRLRPYTLGKLAEVAAMEMGS